MTHNITHPELVRRLAKPGAELLASLDAKKANMWHAATGIAGEGGELLSGVYDFYFDESRATGLGDLEDNILEESGDLYFYIEQLCQEIGLDINFDYCNNGALETYRVFADVLKLRTFVAMQIAIEATNVLDTVKKHVIYNKPLDKEKLQLQLAKLVIHIMVCCYSIGADRPATLAANIKKLMKRYGAGVYSDQAAQTRADKEEGQ